MMHSAIERVEPERIAPKAPNRPDVSGWEQTEEFNVDRDF
jgi:hypothetical protein